MFPRVVLWYFYFLELPLMLKVDLFFHAKEWFKRKSVMPTLASISMHFLRSVPTWSAIWLSWGSQHGYWINPDSNSQVIRSVLFLHVFRIQEPFTGFCKIHIVTLQLRQTHYFESWRTEPSSAHYYEIRSCWIHVFQWKKSTVYF